MINKKVHKWAFAQRLETATKKSWLYDARENKFYHSKSWQSARKQVLQNEPLCRTCKENNIIKGANVVDHINPVRLGGDKLDQNNLQPLCTSCHNRKSANERHGK